MDQRRGRTPARYLAPLALVLVAVAVLVVVGSTETGSDAQDKGDKASRTSRTQQRTDTAPRRTPATYTVRTGDTLGAIAEKTGVSVARLQELNPELDPQQLLSGQMIKLRE
jgi:LysM repeat protein